jgi:superfamily II DNA or RNA helicase
MATAQSSYTATLTRHGLRIPKQAVTSELKEQLTVTPEQPAGAPGAPPKPFKAFMQAADGALYVPRYFGGLPGPYRVVGEPVAHTRAKMQFVGTLRPAQELVVQDALAACRSRGGSVLVLPTGFGKTVLALYIACQLVVKVLVCAHKSFLLDQWQERIAQYVPGAAVGRIQQGVVDVVGKDIVLGMLQSISRRDYPASAFAGFGLLVVDESHHISAPVFSQAMFKACCKYTDGLGCGGSTPLLQWFLGMDVIDKREANKVPATIHVVRYDCPAYRLPPPMMRGGQNINLAKIVTGLVEDVERCALITSFVVQAAGSGRSVLVLSDRRAHCKQLLRLFLDSGATQSASLYVGGMKTAELAEAGTKDVLFATYGLVSEGLDIKRLSTLVMATPRSDVAQAVGRVLRGAADPEVFDLVDNYGVFHAQHAKRRRFYLQAGFCMRSAAQAAASDDDAEQAADDSFGFLSDEDD